MDGTMRGSTSKNVLRVGHAIVPWTYSVPKRLSLRVPLHPDLLSLHVLACTNTVFDPTPELFDLTPS